MRIIITLALLALPIAEIWLLIHLFQLYGGWVLLYLVVIGWLGLQLFRTEKVLFSGRMMQSVMRGGSPMRAMLGAARNMIAGVLLMIPGVITDIIAAILLLIPINRDKYVGVSNAESYQSDAYQEDVYETPSREPIFKNTRQASNDDVIDAEFTEIKEEKDPK